MGNSHRPKGDGRRSLTMVSNNFAEGRANKFHFYGPSQLAASFISNRACNVGCWTPLRTLHSCSSDRGTAAKTSSVFRKCNFERQRARRSADIAGCIGCLRGEPVGGPVSPFHPFMIFAFTPFAIAMWVRQGPEKWVDPILETAATGTARFVGARPLARNSPCCDALTKPGGLTANAKATEGHALQ